MTIVVNAFEIVTTTVRERKYYIIKRKLCAINVLMKILRKGGRNLKSWSCGCSSNRNNALYSFGYIFTIRLACGYHPV